MFIHICDLSGPHLKGFSLSSGHFATWLYGNRTFLSFSLSKGSGQKADKNPVVKVTLLEVFIQLEKPVENPENFFFVEKCTVLAKTVKVQWGNVCLRDIENSRLVHFHAHCQWVHLVCE